jgi:N-acetylglucosamine-6-phosphate deacetylase
MAGAFHLRNRKKAMPAVLITNGQLITPSSKFDDGAVLLQGKRILAAGPPSAFDVPSKTKILDARGGVILPGLIDVHIHGAHGYDCGGADLAKLIQILPQHGITAFLPTTYITTHERLLKIVSAMTDVIEDPPVGARVLGIHMEGPWLNPERAGMGNPDLFYPLNEEDVHAFQEASRGHIRMMTFAPEMGQALQVIPLLVKEGIIPTAGHTNAEYATVQRAVALGLNHATHTYNAMRGLHHRKPGTLGAVFDLDEIIAQMIADGIHLHPAAMRILIRVKGTRRICIVSDATPPAAAPPGEYEWEGYTLYHDGQQSRLENGTLAGSVTLINQMLRVLVEEVGLSLREAVMMATDVPATLLGVPKGRLAPGYDADLVVLGPDYEPYLTLIQGEVVYQAEEGKTR